MAVLITQHYPDGGADYQHDAESGEHHIGHMTPAEFEANSAFATVAGPGNSQQPWLSRIAVICPTCGAISAHPISGGADPQGVQRTFAVKLKARQHGRSWAQSVAIAKSLSKQEGGGWTLPDDATEVDPGGHGRPGTVPGLPPGGPPGGPPGTTRDASPGSAP